MLKWIQSVWTPRHRSPKVRPARSGPGVGEHGGRRRTLVVVPGYNEPDKDMGRLIDGRHRIPGLSAHGFDCVCFPKQDDTLHDRIDRFADFLQRLKKERPQSFPVVTLGYSLGAIVARGFLRAFPERADDVSHTIQLGAPNWGLTTDVLPRIAWALRIPDKALADIDIRSLFMKWLNGTGGHWTRRPHTRWRFWKLDQEPIVAPPGARILSIIGKVPSYGDDNDGIVWNDSSTLDERIPSVTIRDERANHLNLVGLFNLGTLLIKGLRADDRIWPRVIATVADFVHGAQREAAS